MASNGGKRPGAGRKRGIPNKATIERALIAQRDLEAIKAAAKADPERQLAIDKLEKFMNLCEGAAAFFQPRSPEQLRSGIPENPNKDWDLFGEWIDRAIYASKELANYQSAKLKAIMVSSSPIIDQPRTIEGQSNVVALNDAVAVARLYRRVVTASSRRN